MGIENHPPLLFSCTHFELSPLDNCELEQRVNQHLSHASSCHENLLSTLSTRKSGCLWWNPTQVSDQLSEKYLTSFSTAVAPDDRGISAARVQLRFVLCVCTVCVCVYCVLCMYVCVCVCVCMCFVCASCACFVGFLCVLCVCALWTSYACLVCCSICLYVCMLCLRVC